MSKTHNEIKSILQEITHKSVGELYSKYDFMLPHLYETVFNRRTAEMGLEIAQNTIDEELRFLLEEIEEKGEENEAAFTKLLDFSGRAILAMDNQSKPELAQIRKETQELVDKIKELEQKAYYDDITGLLNRSGFRKEICTSNKFDFDGALFFIDLDGFKAINDTHGHGAGNSALLAFSTLLKKQLNNIPKNMKYFSRAGGDEFLIAVTTTNETYAHGELLKIQEKKLKISLGNSVFEPIGFSIGKAYFTQNEDFEKAIMEADKAMYQNKKARKNTQKKDNK